MRSGAARALRMPAVGAWNGRGRGCEGGDGRRRCGRGGKGPQPGHAATAAPAPPVPEHVRVAIIGAGFGGLGAGIRLRQAGMTDFVILERAASVGGTWRDNTYPGCACDIPSHLYSFSFAPNPGWTHSFSRQPEIWDYLEEITDRYGLRGHLRLEAEVTEARWDAGLARWRLRITRTGSAVSHAGPDPHTGPAAQTGLTAGVLISAAGPLSEPRLPDIPGLAEFPGEVFHSARWDHAARLDGRRVAVVGTGASAIQIVPEIQPTAARVVLFQRTPAWVLPRRDRIITGQERWIYRHLPPAQRLARLGNYLAREPAFAAFVARPGMLKAAQRIAARHLARSVTDPALRAKLTPRYVMGCKRILLSSDFYPALTRPNVEVVAAGLARVDGRTVIAGDGTARDVDVIILATGFRAVDMPIAGRITGANGVTLAQAWGGDMRALRRTTLPGFPNLCLRIRPNTRRRHSSMVHNIESSPRHIPYQLATLARTGAAPLHG